MTIAHSKDTTVAMPQGLWKWGKWNQWARKSWILLGNICSHFQGQKIDIGSHDILFSISWIVTQIKALFLEFSKLFSSTLPYPFDLNFEARQVMKVQWYILKHALHHPLFRPQFLSFWGLERTHVFVNSRSISVNWARMWISRVIICVNLEICEWQFSLFIMSLSENVTNSWVISS